MEHFLPYLPYIRLLIFVGLFALLACWETVAPWRSWIESRTVRWKQHLSLALINKVAVKVVFPMLAVGMAFKVEQQGVGLLNRIHGPAFLKIVLGMIALDFVMYLQHRMLHRFKILWRVHKVHHMDRFLDISTGVRFHPLEEIFTTGAKLVGITFFGISVWATFLYEILLNAATLFVHTNVALNPKVEKKLRGLWVTPGMHRIHHSDTLSEANSNFGFCLSLWDRWCGSYCPKPQTTERKMVFGLEEYRAPRFQSLTNMLLLPFNVKALRIRAKKPPRLGVKVIDEALPHHYSESIKQETTEQKLN